MTKQKKDRSGLIITAVVAVLLLSAAGYYFYFSRKLDKEKTQVLKEAYDNLQFETGKDVILESSYPSLDELANYLKQFPNVRLSLEGHTDNQGTAKYNQDLSTKRAEAVKNYLVSKGIDATRIDAVGFGMDKPIAENTTPEGRAKNRRVEFKIVK